MKLSPSLLSADFGDLRAEARQVEALASFLHMDVMDGHFVDNLTFGPPVVNALRRGLSRPFDIHLMIDRPLVYAPRFALEPGDVVTFHVEAQDDPEETIQAIRELGAGVGMSLRPGTPIEALFPFLDAIDLVLVMSVEPGFGGQGFQTAALSRIRGLRKAIGSRPVVVSVDGGIHAGNVRDVVDAGAEIIVAGSAIFGAADRGAAMRTLLEAGG
jgi:ribulose-phosphate 3-epimerase